MSDITEVEQIIFQSGADAATARAAADALHAAGFPRSLDASGEKFVDGAGRVAMSDWDVEDVGTVSASRGSGRVSMWFHDRQLLDTDQAEETIVALIHARWLAMQGRDKKAR